MDDTEYGVRRELVDAQPEPEFRLTAEHFNAALQAAGVQGLNVTDEPEGLSLDCANLEYREIVDRLLNGLVVLHYRA